MDTVRMSALEADSRRKFPCCPGDLNPHHFSQLLGQLSWPHPFQILTSCQPHRVTSEQITHPQFFYSSSKHKIITKPHRRSWSTVLDIFTQSTANTTQSPANTVNSKHNTVTSKEQSTANTTQSPAKNSHQQTQHSHQKTQSTANTTQSPAKNSHQQTQHSHQQRTVTSKHNTVTRKHSQQQTQHSHQQT